MKIGPADVRASAPALPLEVVSCIVSYVVLTTPEHKLQRTLWAFSLVSRTWYSSAVSRLYERPRLTNGNFDKFLRSICLTRKSRLHKIGVEDLVKNLDMGRLAYESSKSETARLLRRCGRNLEGFVAPAVCFSVSSLAPLSKCRMLRSLDLSKFMFELGLHCLLHALRNLDSLHSLHLPQAVFKSHKVYDTSLKWPSNLSLLKFNGGYPCDEDYWRDMVQTWPSTLTSIASNDRHHLISGVVPKIHGGSSLPQITKLILEGTPNRMLEDLDFVEACPNVVELSLPVNVAHLLGAWLDRGGGQSLRYLKITANPPQLVHGTFTLPYEILETLATYFLPRVPLLLDVEIEQGVFDQSGEVLADIFEDQFLNLTSQEVQDAIARKRTPAIRVVETQDYYGIPSVDLCYTGETTFRLISPCRHLQPRTYTKDGEHDIRTA